ncbi:MAG: metal ABC transporter solute-binding protein, Zn/Mn family [Candidatus Nanopelagicales bacterium]
MTSARPLARRVGKAAPHGLVRLAPLAGAALVLAACGGSSNDATAPSDGTPTIVATTTVLGSIAGEIAECAGGSVTTVMPIGADPHDFSPSSADVATMVGANVVIANGLGLEEGLADALEGARADGATVIEIAPLVDPIEFGGGAHADEGAVTDERDHGSLDPHVWFDMNRMADAAVIIGDALAETGGSEYADCGAQVADEIRTAEGEVRALLESVPEDRRILVTDHDALGYLADAYGYEVAGVVIPGGSTLAEPSSAELSALVEAIRVEGVSAIFANTADSSALSDAVASEAGGSVQVVELYVGSLGGPDSGADTYVAMMLLNAQRIAGALRA